MSGTKLWEGLWRSDKTQLQTGPPLRTGMWYFHVGSLSSKPTAAWHTPLWSMWRVCVMHPFFVADTMWERMSGQSQQRASELTQTHSWCTRALKCVNLHNGQPVRENKLWIPVNMLHLKYVTMSLTTKTK